MLKTQRFGRVLQLGVALAVLTFFLLALYSLLPDIVAYRWDLHPGYLALALVILVVRGPIGAHGWWAIMKRLGHGLPWWQSLRMVFYSTMAGYLPGGMWHAVSRVYLAEKAGVPRVITGLSVVIESALVALAAALIAPLAALSWPEFPLWVVLGSLAFLCGFVLFPNLLFQFVDWALVRLKRAPSNVRMTPREMAGLLWPFILNWTLFGIMSFALVAALYPALPLSEAPAVAGVHVSAWLLGYLAVFIPQGLVVREAVIVGFLVGALGLPVPVATAAALLNRIWSMLGVGIWGTVSTRIPAATVLPEQDDLSRGPEPDPKDE
jgi:uncharacterized membrane protein YbhN (UPF0104 family)